MRHRAAITAVVLSLAALAFPATPLQAQTSLDHPITIRPKVRIRGPVDDSVRVPLPGNRHPLARPEYEVGLAATDRAMERMILVLDSDADQQKALEELIAGQHNPHSPQFHRWLTPETFGRQFGVSQHDLERVVSWLESQGLKVEEIASGRRAILFSGATSQVEAAFHTRIRGYRVDGEMHYANATDPEIPQALAGVVRGIAALHDFRSEPALAAVRPVAMPQFAGGGGSNYLAPGDFATIYDVAPLYQNSIDGTGQSIAVVARSNPGLSDVRTFRGYFGLPAKDPNIIVNGQDPGTVSSGEESEALLDVEWSGAVAKNAAIQFVVSASTNTSDGAYLSAVYIVNHNVAPVVTMSFGICEAALGSAGNAMINGLWQQAAAQGMTVLVSSGDSGAAGCDAASAGTASHAAGVNGLCSTPYSVCVGGTEFTDTSNASLYWSGASNPTTKSSALQYIPETVWNDSGIMPGGSGLWAGGGGASTVYAKPVWQAGSGVPADARRDVPDVALTASLHDGYLIYMNGQLYSAGGTSAAAPSFAGLMALAVQKTGARQGNANTVLYALANNQRQSGGAAVFHDVVTGSNSVPNLNGFNAAPGYDLATGLGSVDAALIVNNWTSAPGPAPALQLGLPSAAVSLAPGGSVNVNATVSVSGGFNSTVQLSAASLPSGVSASFAPATLPAPGSGASVLTLNAGSQVVPGTYSVQVAANGGGLTQTGSLTITVTASPGLTLAVSAPSLTVAQGAAATAGITVGVTGGFRAAVALSVAGVPSGVTASLVPASFAAPGSGSSTLKLSASTAAAPGSYTIQLRASGGGITQTASLPVSVVLPPTLTLSATPGPVTLLQGASTTLNVNATGANGFNSAVALSVTGLKTGVAASFSPSSLPAPGSGSSLLTLSATAQATVATYAITIRATGGGLSMNWPVTLVVTPPPSFTLSANTKSVAVVQGASSNVNLSLAAKYGFNASVGLTVSGLGSGVTASFSTATLPLSGSGTSILTINAASAAPLGNSTVTIAASGGGMTVNLPITVTVNPPPSFSLKDSVTTGKLAQGSSLSLTVTITGMGGFSSSVALSISGLPAGVTASFSPSALSGAGTHNSTLKLTAASSATLGAAPLTITASGGGIVNTASLNLTVAAH